MGTFGEITLDKKYHATVPLKEFVQVYVFIDYENVQSLIIKV